MAMSYTEFREAIARCRAGRDRWRCPLPLREEIVQFTRECLRNGTSVSRVARELDLCHSVLNRWLKAGKSHLRPVRIADEASAATDEDLLTLVTPGGYRLEGLRVASAAELLRRLAC